jgi:dienelactone hydrolase
MIMNMKRISLLIPLFFISGILAFSQAVPVISSDFAGGNIVHVKTEADTIWLKPDLSETAGDWFYWYFKVSNISGKQLFFQFTMDNQFAAFGPAYSINNDHSWKWYGENRVHNNGFSISFSPEDTVAWFCTAFPYTGKDLDSFLGQSKITDGLVRDTLCLSPEGRVIEKLSIQPSGDGPRTRVLITARHHACEMMANYVLEGIIESIVNEVDLEYLREKVEFLIVPFVDKDGVENGEQGKNRIPRDHNRDYAGESIYQSTAAIRDEIPAWSDGRLKIALDLHCPWIKGKYHEWISLVGKKDPVMEAAQIRFCELLEENARGELPFRSRDFLPYGTDWNVGGSYTKGMSFSQWATGIDNISLATTIEFPYANILGIQVSKDNARAFGKAVSFALMDYLKGIDNLSYSAQNEDYVWKKDWPVKIQEISIPSTMDDNLQKAMFFATSGDGLQPLIVSLHTWSGDYRQKDPLAPMIIEKGWNYIHPDFRGSNNHPEACGSEKVIPDIEDAIRYAMEHGHVDPDNIHVIGTSGGGYATLLMYMKTSLDIRSFSAWVPISDLVDWYWACDSRGLKYAGDILKSTGSQDSVLDVDEARRRSPYFMDTPVSRRKKSLLNIYCGIHDGYTGSVPITQSINFYNKVVSDMKGDKDALITREDALYMLSQQTFKPADKAPLIGVEGRRIHYRKIFRSINLTIFEGGHELLPGAAMEELLTRTK